MTRMVMFQFTNPNSAPTVEDAARILNIDISIIDAEYGAILIDPQDGTYMVLVDGGDLGSSDEQIGPMDVLLTPRAETYLKEQFFGGPRGGAMKDASQIGEYFLGMNGRFD